MYSIQDYIPSEGNGSLGGTSPCSRGISAWAIQSLADKVLNGIPAGTIPVVTPEQDLWINYKVAQELGLRVSEGLLSMAEEIIR